MALDTLEAVDSAGSVDSSGPKSTFEGTKRRGEQAALYIFVIVPFLAFLAAVPIAWGWGLSWTDVIIAAVFYELTGHGITVGYHRFFTHGSFKANRTLKIALAIAGSMAIEGPVIRWVADHRRHHAYSDKEGDPHSPWRYGETLPALMKGLGFAHLGWLFDVEHTSRERFTPDLMRDADLRWVDRFFPLWVTISLVSPVLIGGLVTWSWTGAITASASARATTTCITPTRPRHARNRVSAGRREPLTNAAAARLAIPGLPGWALEEMSAGGSSVAQIVMRVGFLDSHHLPLRYRSVVAVSEGGERCRLHASVTGRGVRSRRCTATSSGCRHPRLGRRSVGVFDGGDGGRTPGHSAAMIASNSASSNCSSASTMSRKSSAAVHVCWWMLFTVHRQTFRR